MSKKANSALDRRSAIRVGAVGAAATAATVGTVATASSASAAAGQPILAGRANGAGASGTTLVSNGSAITLTVKNTGTGAAAYFFGQNNNGFAGGTGAGSKYGLSAANTGAPATGAGLAASGNNNSGVLANTGNLDRFAVEAVNLSTSNSGEGSGGGLWADGGEGVGIAAISPIGVPAVVSIGDLYFIEGHEVVETAGGAVVYGVTSAMGPEVVYSTQLTLNGSGAATWDLTGPGSDDVDLTDAVSLVSANSGPMPNLWITTNGSTNVISVAGGTAGGTVSVRVIGTRLDWSGYDAAKTGRAAGGARVATAKKFARRLAKRANRG